MLFTSPILTVATTCKCSGLMMASHIYELRLVNVLRFRDTHALPPFRNGSLENGSKVLFQLPLMKRIERVSRTPPTLHCSSRLGSRLKASNCTSRFPIFVIFQSRPVSLYWALYKLPHARFRGGGFQINTGRSLADFVTVDAHKATITEGLEAVIRAVPGPGGGARQFYQRVRRSIPCGRVEGDRDDL